MEQDQTEATQKLLALKKAYHEIFSTDAGKMVLADLEGVCFEHTSTIHAVPHVMAYQEGHRAVLKHIKSRMELQHVMSLLTENEGEPNV